MNWRNHLKWGIIVVIVLIAAFIYFREYIDIGLLDNSKFGLLGIFIPNYIIAILIGAYASIFPDIDIGTSKAFSITYMILILLAFYFMFTQYLTGLAISLAIMIFILTLKHRGLMHKWYTGMVLGILFYILFDNIAVGIFFFAGFMTHLACDTRVDD